ncbi:MAG: type II toxin-antitoxin system VapC family toxin [Pirellulales bacterium]
MPENLIVDASVAVAWVHPAQSTPETQAMLAAVAAGAGLEVPALWPLEVANALLALKRRGRLTERERKRGLEQLRLLPQTVDHDMAAIAFNTLSELAVTYGLSVYDAAYLELAIRRKLPLACKDGPLLAAAKKAGIRVWR